jgi:hypothetical protein
MAMNRVQFQPGLSMAAFLQLYGTQVLCRAALEQMRWHLPSPKNNLSALEPKRQLGENRLADQAQAHGRDGRPRESAWTRGPGRDG